MVAQVPPAPAIVLRSRMQQGWLYRLHRRVLPVSTIALATLAGITVALEGFTSQALLMVSAVVMLAGDQILIAVLTRFSIAVQDGSLQAQVPLRSTRAVPLASVKVQIPLKFRGVTTTLYRSVFALAAADGSTIAVLSERTFPQTQLAALLALLPPVERESTPRTMRDVWKSYKVSAPPSVRDRVLFGAGTLLAYGGLAGVVVAFITLPHHAAGP